DCLENPQVRAYLDEQCSAGGPFSEVLTFDLRESMRNGGGPACLRLRVALTGAEQAAVAPGIWMDERLYSLLDAWAERHYRDRLTSAELADPALLEESHRALDELTQLLGLGSSLYAFQRNSG
ncbi:MAG: N-succinylarginine dihydrolase, partial [Janthinobacterium lividum]